MLIHIRQLLCEDEIRKVGELLDRTEFVDGTTTAGVRAALVKRNLQADEATAETRQASELVITALGRSAPFRAAVRPKAMLPALFSRYEPGMAYGEHLDNPIMGHPIPLRTDVSVTVFLNDPAEYDGGELVVQSDSGVQAIRGGAGDAFAYPSNLFHSVAEVTRGVRKVAVTWVQSLVRDPGRRRILYDLELAVESLRKGEADETAIALVRKSQMNLLRLWGDV